MLFDRGIPTSKLWRKGCHIFRLNSAISPNQSVRLAPFFAVPGCVTFSITSRRRMTCAFSRSSHACLLAGKQGTEAACLFRDASMVAMGDLYPGSVSYSVVMNRDPQVHFGVLGTQYIIKKIFFHQRSRVLINPSKHFSSLACTRFFHA